METWPEATPPVVSCVCHTYNHRRFLVQALEGMLEQETSFPFEIVLHDDASTDGTTDIVRDYAARYPRIIRPIVQETNQYSKGISPARATLPTLRGRFFAFCEGDDFWRDPRKLQRQVDALAANPTCDLCFHAVDVLDEVSGDYSFVKECGPLERVFSAADVIRRDPVRVQAVSMMVRTELVRDPPSWLTQSPVGDYPHAILGSLRGGAVYLPDRMAVYRSHAAGWSGSRTRTEQADWQLTERIIGMLNGVPHAGAGISKAIMDAKRRYVRLYAIRHGMSASRMERMAGLDVHMTAADRLSIGIARLRPMRKLTRMMGSVIRSLGRGP